MCVNVDIKVWVSDLIWVNYILLIGNVGLIIEIYFYFDKVFVLICFDVMMECLC